MGEIDGPLCFVAVDEVAQGVVRRISKRIVLQAHQRVAAFSPVAGGASVTGPLVRPLRDAQLAAFPLEPAHGDAKSMGSQWLRQVEKCHDLGLVELQDRPPNLSGSDCGSG